MDKSVLLTSTGKINSNITLERLIKLGKQELIDDIYSFTSYDPDIDFRKRIFLYVNGYDAYPICARKGCQNILKLYKTKFNTFCSNRCAQLDPNIQGKIAKTCTDRYGVDCVFKSEEVKQNIKDNYMEQYGVDNVAKIPSIREKIKQSYQKKSQVEKDDITNKRKKTCIEVYGVETPFLSPVIQDKIKNTMLDRYGVEHPFQHDEIYDRFIQTMVDRYGSDNFNRKQIFELDDKDTLEQLTEKYNMAYIASNLGVSKSTVGIKVKKHGIDYKKKYTSSLEMEVYDFIRTLYDGEIITRATDVIQSYELDLYIPEFNLAIECNGIVWHSEVFGGKDRNYHLIKTRLCRSKGIRLIHVMEDKWHNKKDVIRSIISHAINANQTKVYARNCVVGLVDKKTERSFINENHISGYITGSKIRLGLFHDDQLIYMMTFCKPRYGNKDAMAYEILRSCSKVGYNVIGGFSKLFSYFCKNHTSSGDRILSYCDASIYNGISYHKSGFEMMGFTPPSYRYFQKNWRYMLEDRMKYQKHKLKNILENYDPNKSEWDNMKENGYDRIWDCGNSKWVFTVE